MVKFWDCVPEELIPWIEKQHLFFVATAPLTGSGHVNLSPKGLRGSFHVESKHRVWYEDLSGSGVETIAHVRENGRITLMFCAFEGAARIVRLFGVGTVYEFGTPEYAQRVPPAARLSGSRAVVVVDVHKASTSCGYAVPMYAYKAQRRALLQWSGKMERLDAGFARDAASCPSEPVEIPWFSDSPSSPDLSDASATSDASSSSDDKGKTQAQAQTQPQTQTQTRVYATRGMKWWWASANVRSLDGLPGLRTAHLSDVVSVGVEALPAAQTADEPPSDGAVVILGNRVPAAGPLERARAWTCFWAAAVIGEGGGRGEVWRLALAFAIGVATTAVYVRETDRNAY